MSTAQDFVSTKVSMAKILAKVMVQLLLIRDEGTTSRSRPHPRLLSELCDHRPQQFAVSDVFLAREARLAGQMMAEGGADLLPGAAPFFPTLLGTTPGTTASSPYPGAGVHFVPELWSPFPSLFHWAPAGLPQSKETVSASLNPQGQAPSRSPVSLSLGDERELPWH